MTRVVHVDRDSMSAATPYTRCGVLIDDGPHHRRGPLLESNDVEPETVARERHEGFVDV